MHCSFLFAKVHNNLKKEEEKKNDCKRSKTRSKHIKGSKETSLLGQDETKNKEDYNTKKDSKERLFILT